MSLHRDEPSPHKHEPSTHKHEPSPHKHEPTTYSLTDTVVDHGKRKAPSLPLEFLPQLTVSHSTHSDPAHDAPGKPGSEGLGEKPDSFSVPRIIPDWKENDPPRPRTLVLCFDGTGDQFDDDNSNVVQFVSLLAKKDRNKQMVYYQVRKSTTQDISSTY